VPPRRFSRGLPSLDQGIMRARRRGTTLLIVGLITAQAFGAQSPPANAVKITFDVTSIKPNNSLAGLSSMGFPPGGRFTATNISLRELIRLAYGMPPQLLPASQLLGGPNWIDSERFDIMATAGDDALVASGGPSPQMILMIRALMEDRFKLTLHEEDRELPIYALVMARKEGKLGPRLSRTQVDCSALRAARGTIAPSPGSPPPLPPPGVKPRCGSNGSPGRLAGSGTTISALSTGLSRGIDRVVIDRTGLTGNFDYQLEWTPDQIPTVGLPVGAFPGGPPPPPPAPIDGPSIFTAVQEQLGLKLESTRGPVNVIVIDRAERPTED
jgi:uncharacterized protein (TIGR03435 family)